ncbi:AAA family ATPase [Candidatus Woesearchaeota archaeon]|jgi:archaeal cell division control protein 6|nr:AAA family ATPase [Candidatus Woesearchaeota archaeon]MBT4110462.1 AAA family ATPase [Candidatus Woesearchaeota archaeon]MBT4336014.1 AAA family ATPase [Candidatus Woesearchaeota archaeon]MBT4469007.1 AAA family ATPase [Candidatus Woesearchaeota archaeon]MBT6744674.1 AAA family ATPase [Candidatus Woesearchaeota archaeon]
MAQIGDFFENFLKKESIFLNKAVLMSAHIPTDILYREEQIQEVANILAPLLRTERPSNLFIYGKTGTGKTLAVKHIMESMLEIAKKNNVPLKPIYVNCKLKRVADTEYRLIAQLIKDFGRDIPSTGLPTDEVYNIFYKLLDQEKKIVLLILDEIDQLTKKIGDEILYNLTRINAELKQSQICLLGISNNLVFSENLDPRVKSSLSEEELIFPPYNAIQIQEILKSRAKVAFKEEVIQPGVIEKCSAYAAREHGDARRAIDLLRVSGELAERAGSTIVKIEHLDDAERKVESDKIINAIVSQPKQFQSVLYSIILISPQKRQFYTGEIYEVYKNICKQTKFNVLTQRRISDILAELDMLGIINAKIISKGRYGRTREVSLSVEENILIKLREILEKSLHIN